jgi:hypothetical protein
MRIGEPVPQYSAVGFVVLANGVAPSRRGWEANAFHYSVSGFSPYRSIRHPGGGICPWGVGAGTPFWYAARKFFLKNTKPTSYTTLFSLFTPFILQYFLLFSPLQYTPFALFCALCYTTQRNKEDKMLVYVNDPATMLFAA